VEKLLETFRNENVEATVIGEFTGTKKLELFYKGKNVCDLEMEFLHDGNPKITKQAIWREPKNKAVKISPSIDLNQKILEVLSHYNVCSKEWVIRQYDHEVQGATIIKPLVGIHSDGPSDASVILPKLNSSRGIAVSNGINPLYGKIDPFWMAASCIDEAVRQIISVGGNVDKIAILDNFCWGNPDKPDRLGSLVRAAQGCYTAAVGYKVPFISGKDSLYNEYTQDNKSISIPGTLLISAVGIIDDVAKAITMDLKRPGNLLYCIGQTFDELGGSIYLDTLGFLGSCVPKLDIKKGLEIFSALSRATKKGLVESIHDCSDGGIGVALAEMAFSGDLGITAHLDQVPCKINGKRDDVVLFSESNTRFIVEVDSKKQKEFEKLLAQVCFGIIGRVEKSPELIIHGLNNNVTINASIDNLREAWKKPLRW